MRGLRGCDVIVWSICFHALLVLANGHLKGVYARMCKDARRGVN